MLEENKPFDSDNDFENWDKEDEKEPKEEIKELIEELGTKKYRKLGRWHQYEVYEPIFEKTVYIGEPIVVLVNDDEIRYSTYDESFEIAKEFATEGEEDE